MAIVAADIKYWLSGGDTNEDADAALGGVISTAQEVTDASPNNLFDDVSGDEASAGDTEYRGFYVKNHHGSLTLQNTKIWISSDTTSPNDEIWLALADEAIDVAMEVIANESTAPSGPTFTRPVTKAGGLSIGNLGPGSFKGVWMQRIVDGGASAVTGNSGTIRVEGDTAA